MSDMPVDYQKKYGPKRSKRKGPSGRRVAVPESRIQAQAEEWLEWNHLPFFRLPDLLMNWVFGYGSKTPEWIKRFLRSYMKDWPDLILFEDEPIPGHGRYLAIELKSNMGKLSDGQKRMQKVLGTVVVRSFMEFVKVVQEWKKETKKT